MESTTIQIFTWTCPDCATVMHDDMDIEDGPFESCVCDNCGKTFEQDAVVSSRQCTHAGRTCEQIDAEKGR